MISVTGLTKRFGSTLAVDNVSFEIPKGQVVGFLGPNGAGKTTTMRLLTGYLPPDDGSARLMGINLLSQSIEVRRRLGYLPENNPLPDDIEVTEYLHYIGRLRGLHNAKDRAERVARVVKSCSLAAVAGKHLGELSKGYRQRVGLAQAIIHDPDILILDEPTSGLDPNQVRDVRELIQHLKAEKTVILSTHILSEVQHSCDRVLIISHGRIVADGDPKALAGSMEEVARLYIALKGPQAAIREEISRMDGVRRLWDDASIEPDGFIIESDAGRDLRYDIFCLAAARNWPMLAMQQKRLSLEEIFRTLTKPGAEGGGESHAN
jgi:ABC-2 type transport system ATP-binding protein